MNAWRSSRPSAVRTGMFCRFGASLEMRPVVVASLVERGVDAAVGARPAAAARRRRCCAASRPRGSAAGPRRSGARRASFCSESASVDGPVFVFFTGVEPELRRTGCVRSCGVELTLNCSPACAWISAAEPSALRRRAPCASSSRNSTVDADAGRLHRREHAHERALDALVEIGRARAPRARRSSASARRSSDRGARGRSRSIVDVAVEVERALGSASGDVQLERRGSAARGRRARYFPSPGSSRYAMTAVSWSQRAEVDAASPCISSLARCATSGGPPSATSAASASRTVGVGEQRRRRCTRRAVVASAMASAAQRAADRRARPARLDRDTARPSRERRRAARATAACVARR